MTTNFDDDGIRASRMRVPRSRGAFSGFVLMILGAWAALVPFIGPYFNFGFLPATGDAWHWTAARGWLEVLPGAAAFLGGFILLVSAHRLMGSIGGWLAAAGGAWLVVGPALAGQISLNIGAPDPAATAAVQTLEQLFYFYAVGAAIVYFAAFGLGRLSVHGVRDVKLAQRRAAAAEEERLAEERRIEEVREAERRGAPRRQPGEQAPTAADGTDGTDGNFGDGRATAGARHGAPGEQPGASEQSGYGEQSNYGTQSSESSPTATYPTQQR